MYRPKRSHNIRLPAKKKKSPKEHKSKNFTLGISDWLIICMYLRLMKAGKDHVQLYIFRVLSQSLGGKIKGDHLFHLYALSFILHLLHYSCHRFVSSLVLSTCNDWTFNSGVFFSYEKAMKFSKRMEKKRKPKNQNKLHIFLKDWGNITIFIFVCKMIYKSV